MKISVKLLAAAAACALTLPSCSDGPDDPTVYYRIIDFENTDITLAGPTSYGENLYETYDGTKFISGAIEVEHGVDFQFGINESLYDDEINFWSGGMVLSQWNYRTSPEGESANWWASYQNQCSVYNTSSVDGANRGAGAGGSNTFAVINGYQDNNSMSSMAEITFSADKEYVIESVELCPTSYLYGTISEGNAFGAEPLKTAGGWFKIMAYGFDANGTATNGGSAVEFYICDYRAGSVIELPSTWQTWQLASLGKVNKVKFQFAGSDTGAYGLNTPAYMALDNFKIRLN